MGMYHDHTSPSRMVWKYLYKGSELLAAATLKRDEAKRLETQFREEMAALMRNSKINADGPEVRDCKKKIEQYAALFEECAVYVHEFGRTPEREFSLGLGDVTFFDLVPTPTAKPAGKGKEKGR